MKTPPIKNKFEYLVSQKYISKKRKNLMININLSAKISQHLQIFPT